MIHHGGYHDLCFIVLGDSLTSKRITTRTEQLTKCYEPLRKLRVRLGTCKIDFGAGASCLLLGPPGSNWCFSFAPELVGYSAPRDLHRRAAYSICESLFLIHQDVYHDLFVCS